MRALSDVDIQQLPRLIDQDPSWFKGRQVLVRADLNVPLTDAGKVLDDTRIQAILPTLRCLINYGAAIRLISHLGKPKGVNPKQSLKALQPMLTQHLGQTVLFDEQWPYHASSLQNGHVTLCENLRFLPGETDDDDALAQRMAQGVDCLVQDAFGCAHRAHASITGLPRHINHCFAGLLLTQEVDTLWRLFQNPKMPFVAVVGGAKLATKLPLIEALAPVCDAVLIGGCLANTFLAAQGHPIGHSLFEPQWLEYSQTLLQQYPNTLKLPCDVVGASCIEDTTSHVYDVHALPQSLATFDIGPNTAKRYQHTVAQAGQVIWNGPMGAFENPAFAQGTHQMAHAMAQTQAITVLGGGETLSAYRQFANPNDVTYSCTGGGAFLALFEAHGLPGIKALINQG